MKKNKYEIDMCNGTIMDKLISFALPLMLSGMLQLTFNAVDIVVIGQFSGKQSLAAVGATTALINVFTNLFIGISLGANVIAARFYAAGRDKEMSETVHTAISLALISGIVMGIIIFILNKALYALFVVVVPSYIANVFSLLITIYTGVLVYINMMLSIKGIDETIMDMVPRKFKKVLLLKNI